MGKRRRDETFLKSEMLAKASGLFLETLHYL
jgi:hypothetical protein